MLSYVSIKFRGFNVVGLTYKIVFCLSVRLLVCYSCNLLFYLLSKSRSIRDSPKWFFKSKKKIIIEKLSGKKNQIAMFLGNHFQLTYQIWKTIAISNYCIHNFFINPKIVWKSKNHRQIQKKILEIPKNSSCASSQPASEVSAICHSKMADEREKRCEKINFMQGGHAGQVWAC